MLLAFRSTPHLSLGIRQTPDLSKDKGFLGTVFYFCHAVLPYASTSSPLPCTSPSPGLGTFKLVAKIKRWYTPFGPRRRGRAWLGPQRLGTVKGTKGQSKSRRCLRPQAPPHAMQGCPSQPPEKTPRHSPGCRGAHASDHGDHL